MEWGKWGEERYLPQLAKDGLTSMLTSSHRIVRLSSSSDPRILERLADEGWDEEISSHRNDYVMSIITVKGAQDPAAPLTEKGTSMHILIENGI